MNLVQIIILIGAGLNIKCHHTNPTDNYDNCNRTENKTTFTHEVVQTDEEILPTKTIQLNDYVHINVNQTDISFPVISSFFVLDLYAVEIMDNFTRNDNGSISARHLQLINRYTAEWKESICNRCLPTAITSQNLSKLSIPEVVGNPAKSFQIIKRLEFELPVILLYDTDYNWKKFVVEKYYSKLAEVGFYHEFRYYVEFGLGLFRLHHVYNIPIDEMLSPNSTNAAHTAAEIGYIAFSQGYFGRAVEWYQYGKKLLKTGQNFNHSLATSSGVLSDEENIKKTYLGILENVTMKFHDLWVEKKGSNSRPGLFTKPFYETNLDEQIAQGLKEKQVLEASTTDDNTDLMFRKLCQGFEPRAQVILKHLNCRYDHRSSEWLLLMPAKVEVASYDPEILIFHNAICEKRLNFMKNISLPIQEEAYVQDTQVSTGRLTTDRKSYVSWTSQAVHDEVMKLGIMISALTGLYASDEKGSAELFQMNVYGSGGFYNVHEDAFNYYQKLKPVDKNQYYDGDRLATFMIYMNEVKSGGRTVFPQLGVSVKPESGSAVFWINLLNSGRPNNRMKHAGCPVISGIKWVTNRWIRLHDQMFVRPCTKEVRSTIVHSQRSTLSQMY